MENHGGSAARHAAVGIGQGEACAGAVGGLVTTMRQVLLFAAPLIVLLAVASSVSAQQDVLASIIIKPKIEARDAAQIRTQVEERVRRLAQAGSDADRRQEARDRLLATARVKGATAAGLEAYAQRCADSLGDLTVSEKLENAFDAVWILVDLNHINTIEALAGALRSQHAAVRIRAARGLQQLHAALGKEPAACRSALRALGQAAAEETQEVVLRVFYDALDLSAEAAKPEIADECGRAVATILESRLLQFESGKRNETLDQPLYELAARCYGNASAQTQARLVQQTFLIARHAVARYYDADTHQDYHAPLAGLIGGMEASLHTMMKAAKVKVPDRGLADVIKKTGKPKDEAVARKALGDLRDALQAGSWGLSLP